MPSIDLHSDCLSVAQESKQDCPRWTCARVLLDRHEIWYIAALRRPGIRRPIVMFAKSTAMGCKAFVFVVVYDDNQIATCAFGVESFLDESIFLRFARVVWVVQWRRQ